MTGTGGSHGLVLGGGFTGVLAAAVLSTRVDSVTIVDRDELPDQPVHRAGVPQAHHGHLLVAQGARLLDGLLDGITAELVDAGGRRLGMPNDMIALTPEGWMPRLPEARFGICASRTLTDWVIRGRVLRAPNITVRTGTEVDGLTGTAHRIVGARVRDRRTGDTRTLSADVVIDATGRGSRARHWLTGLGLPEVATQVVDSGLGYATRLYRAPESADPDFPLVALQPEVVRGRPGQAGVLFPIEHRQWMITLSGTRGGEPPTEESAFHRFAADLRHGVISDLINAATPVGRIHGYRNTANRWHRYDRLRAWPAGFFVVGDALAVTNPTYALGMTMSAAAVTELATVLDEPRRAANPLTAQRAIAATVRTGWRMATLQDGPYAHEAPGAVIGTLRGSINAKLLRAGLHDPVVLTALLDMFTSGSTGALARPGMALRILRAPSRPGATQPPFTARERAVLDDGARKPVT